MKIVSSSLLRKAKAAFCLSGLLLSFLSEALFAVSHERMEVAGSNARPTTQSKALFAIPTERMVVTGSRIPRADIELSESSTIITAADIEQYQYRNLTEALRSVPGLHVSTAGGFGAQTSLFVRGAESDHILVLIDGVKVNDPSAGGLFEFSDIPLSNVERIEVLRGGQSAQYGSEALGGVIHIITHRSLRKARASIERGSFNNRKASVAFGIDKNDIDAVVSVSYRKTDGDSFTPGHLRMGKAKENDAYRNSHANLNVRFPINDQLQAQLYTGYNEVALEYDDYLGENEFLEKTSYAKRNGVALSGDYFDGFWKPSWQFNRYVKDTNDDAFGSVTQHRGERIDVIWNNIFRVNDHVRVVFGANSELERMRIDHFSAQARNRSVYGEVHLLPDENWKLSYSLRNDDADDFSSESSYRFGIVWTNNNELIWRADYATGFKAPSLNDRFRDYPAFGFFANPNLQPETNRHWQLGYELRLKHLDFGMTYFNNTLRHLISASEDGTTLVNRSSAKIEGLESFINYRLTDTFATRLDYTLMRAYDDAHDRLLRRPIRKLSLKAVWLGFEAGDMSLQLDHTGPRDDIDRILFTRKSVGSYSVVHFNARSEVGDDMELFIRVDNLFNKRYEPVDGYKGERRQFNMGLSIRF